MLIDSHCHLSFKDYPEDAIPEILRRASEAGVSLLINVGAGEGCEGNEEALRLAEAHPQIYATVGIHPHDAKIAGPEILKKIELLAQNPKVVAIGEIGLDFYYEHSPRDVQEKVFGEFIDLALKLKKPIVIHDRGAGERTYEILKDQGQGTRDQRPKALGHESLVTGHWSLPTMIHCFTGIITFKKSVELMEIVKTVPLDRLLVETDSPYLTPEPHRGKKNEP
ncbi:MAG: TatD family hydrolase, partial [Deltaproteobacteria bacterium]|nr:TatD family hydrolase [Deltaproteobacteria bacterium]